MSYPTRHKLEILENNGVLDINSLIECILYDLEDTYCFSEGLGEYGEARTWYERDEVMKEISCRYKGVLFFLEGEGEENGDIWKEYYKNGKMQHIQAVIKFDEEYHEDKLK